MRDKAESCRTLGDASAEIFERVSSARSFADSAGVPVGEYVPTGQDVAVPYEYLGVDAYLRRDLSRCRIFLDGVDVSVRTVACVIPMGLRPGMVVHGAVTMKSMPDDFGFHVPPERLVEMRTTKLGMIEFRNGPDAQVRRRVPDQAQGFDRRRPLRIHGRAVQEGFRRSDAGARGPRPRGE